MIPAMVGNKTQVICLFKKYNQYPTTFKYSSKRKIYMLRFVLSGEKAEDLFLRKDFIAISITTTNCKKSAEEMKI